MKRAVDLFLGSVTVLVLFPVGLLVAGLIKLDSRGSVFYTEQRLGRNGTPFKVYKYRTMYVDAPEIRGEDGSWENPPDDPRVTRIGRLLRSTSLDELPQLLNVLFGHMSLVGPRPDPVAALDTYEPGELARLSVRPGLTGWAAVHGRKALPLRQRRALDLEYVERRSLALDLRILALTIPAVLRREGVYSGDDERTIGDGA